MDTYRLKVKIGEHEFEAEGDPETVKQQFEVFKSLVTMPTPVTAGVHTPHAGGRVEIFETPLPLAESANLQRIMRQDGRVISLTARAENPEDAVLLIMLGQRALRENDSVTGMELSEGLGVSGIRVGRVDRLLDRIAGTGLVIVIGQHRGRRYRLTNAGLARGREIAATLIATVA
jgi:hypothetical protein